MVIGPLVLVYAVAMFVGIVFEVDDAFPVAILAGVVVSTILVVAASRHSTLIVQSNVRGDQN